MTQVENTSALSVIHKYDTILCSDSVEWCPVQFLRNIFVCGNYQLEEDKSNGTSDEQRDRFGRVLLFEYSFEDLKLLQTINTDAVLDQKWCHHAIQELDTALLGVVTAKASLILYKLQKSKMRLTEFTRYTFKKLSDSPERLLLSLDWSTGKTSDQEPQIVCSDSLGSIHLFKLMGDGLKLLETWPNIHSESAWITAFNYWNTNIIYSGGDDCIMNKIDLRDKSVIKVPKVHESGMTSAHHNKENENLLATGSYDEFMRVFDERFLKKPLDSFKMDGPIWRVKWHPYEVNSIGSACMRGGLSITDVKTKCIETFPDEQDGITYGFDWCHEQESKSIASCTFYSHQLFVLKYNSLYR